MKIKIIITIIAIILVTLCYFISGLFFFNSGIMDNNLQQLNETRTIEILRELDKIPLINTNADHIEFNSYGIITKISKDSISIKTHNEIKTFSHNQNISNLKEDDKIWIYYTYSQDYKKEIKNIRKILQLKDVVDFKTCHDYGGYIENWDFPRKCIIDQVTFKETINDLKQACNNFNGTWIKEFRECEMISEYDCYDLSGEYFECESPCRHNPDSEECIMMCVQVCKFK